MRTYKLVTSQINEELTKMLQAQEEMLALQQRADYVALTAEYDAIALRFITSRKYLMAMANDPWDDTCEAHSLHFHFHLKDFQVEG
jgi:hypothetical protein